MTLQNKVLDRYRQAFPNETLREISLRTGIQITRVFRLFNGRTMKVGELEALENAIARKRAENPSAEKLVTALDEALLILTNDELRKLNEYLERKLVSKKYARFYVSTNVQNAVIA